MSIFISSLHVAFELLRFLSDFGNQDVVKLLIKTTAIQFSKQTKYHIIEGEFKNVNAIGVYKLIMFPLALSLIDI